jgi:hypothetical protein
MDAIEKQKLVDDLLSKSTLTPEIKVALDVMAAVQADLAERRAEPNNDTLQSARVAKIYKVFAPIDLDDPQVKEDIEAGLTLEDLEGEADFLRDIVLHQAHWIAFGFSAKVSVSEDGPESLAQQTAVDEMLAAQGFDDGVVLGLNAISAMKASVYESGPANFTALQKMRTYEILNCYRNAEIARTMTAEELASDPRELAWAVHEWDLMLHQARWIAFALSQ